MIIGIDLDSTLIETHAVAQAAKDLNLPITNKDTLHWNHLNFPPHFRQRTHEYFVNEKLMCDDAVPIEGAQETITRWTQEGHTIVLITARGGVLEEATRRMVNRLFPEITDINFVPMDQSKIEVMYNKKIDVWIDDAPHGIKDSCRVGIPTIMISNNYTKYNWHVRNIPGISSIVKKVSEINLSTQ